MTAKEFVLALAASAALPLAACDTARPVASSGNGQSACTVCHGDANRPEDVALNRAAPPVGVAGGGGGGAHLAHLHGGAFRGPVACSDCHVVPTLTSHADGSVAITFSPLAGANPSYDPGTGTCSSVYCHGATLSGGPAASPPWSSTAALDCSSCHGYPPPNHAPTSTNCSTCHPGTVRADGSIDVANGLHVNGTVDAAGAVHAPGWENPDQHGRAANADLASCQACHGADFDGGSAGVSCNACHAAAGFPSWQTTCTFCHGDPARQANAAAPPVGTQGETSTTARAVGAHQQHLSGGAIGAAVACTECHAVPTGISHVDGTAAVTFGAAARRDGATPAWNGASCSGVYCHGATLAAGGTNQAPDWTSGPSQAACGTCHGLPPPSPHPATASCGTCHTGYTAGSVNPASHLNGVLDVSAIHPAGWADKAQHGYQANQVGLAGCKSCHGADLTGGTSGISCSSCHAAAGFPTWATSCTFCHGNRQTGRMSPPVDTQGRTATSNVSVGVHDSHVGTTIATPLACGECHPARGSVVTDAAHVDGDAQAEVVFGALARTGGAAPTYSRASATSATCASTYCHGSFSGGANATPNWTSTAQVTCTSCHGGPPSTGQHSRHVNGEGIGCGTCHPGSSSSSVNAAIHVNGTDDVQPGGGTWNPTTRTCSSVGCHGTESW